MSQNLDYSENIYRQHDRRNAEVSHNFIRSG